MFNRHIIINKNIILIYDISIILLFLVELNVLAEGCNL